MPRRNSSSPQRRPGVTPPGGDASGSNTTERGLVIHRVVKEIGGGGSYPTLTKTNYTDWAALMRVMLQARSLWVAVSEGTDDYVEDRMALEAIAKAVPVEMMGAIAGKATAKIAWEAIKTMNIGVERVRKAKASTLRREFDTLKFRDGETVDEFGVRITGIANQLVVLGDSCDEEEIVRKFLQAVPPKYAQIAMAIETLIDLDGLSVEELIGRLKAAEERHDLDGRNGSSGGSVARLNLTEEELLARITSRLQLSGEGSSEQGKGSGSGQRRGRGRGRGKDGGGRGKSKWSKAGGYGGSGTVANDQCRYCGKIGHWARECRKKKRDEQANVAQVEEDQEPTLLMAAASPLTRVQTSPAPSPGPVTKESVELIEDRLFVQLGEKGDADYTRWILDTGATNHMTGAKSAFSELDTGVRGSVKFGDGSVVGIEGRGTVLFTCKSGEHQALTGVYHIPRLTANIVSLGQLDEDGFDIQIGGGVIRIRDKHRRLLAKVHRSPSRLYVLTVDIAKPVCLAAQGTSAAWRWHARYGHLNFRSLRKLAQERMVKGLPWIDHIDQVCDSCLAGKQRRLSFPSETTYRATQQLELIHGDICGPVTPATPSGNRFFLLLVDDLSRYMWLILLNSKDQAAAAVMRFQMGAEAEAGRKMGTLRTDRGGEFTARAFADYCADQGIQRHFTAPYTPQQNGVVERRNQTVMGMARSMMKAMAMPGWFWGEAVTTAVFVLNRAPTQSIDGKTPYEVWHGSRPPVHFLRTFGCVAHVKAAGKHLAKLDDRSAPMVFVGYEPGTKAYRFYNPLSRRVHISRDAVFEEDRSWDWGADKGVGPSDDAEPFHVEHITVVTRQSDSSGSVTTYTPPTTPASVTMPIYGSEPNTTPLPASPGIEFVSPPTGELDLDVDHDDAPLRFRTLANILGVASPPKEADRELAEELMVAIGDEPATAEEAKQSMEWRKAMLEEMVSIEENKSWSLVDLPQGQRAIGLKWVFKLKRDEHGEIVKFKARLVAKGYVQRQGIDYEEVFAPVARMESIRVVLAVAACRGWPVHHMDVKSAFLNGELAEEVYVTQPPGFVAVGHERKVLKLHKALYGLRQAPRAWNAKLDASLHALGFSRSECEHGLYMRGVERSRLVVGIYVDDLIITGEYASEIDSFKMEMKKLFRMSDLGNLSYYLGIEVKQGRQGIELCQAAYAKKLLEKGGMARCNPCATPMETRLKLSKQSSSPAVDATEYRSLIGSLRYLMHTRPDLAFAVGYLSRFMENPKQEHMAAMKHLLRYVAGTINYGLVYMQGDAELNLVGYSDSDMAGDVDDRKSTSGIIFFLGCNPVTWQSQKQRVVALSSCEAEYIAGAAAACQGVWIRRLLSDVIGVESSPPQLKIDNMSAIALSKNPVLHDRSKHIDTKFHYIRECVDSGEIGLEFAGTQEQLADILTKPLGRVKFQELRRRIGVTKLR